MGGHDYLTVKAPNGSDYPRCDCGQPLWAPQSQQRGFCERCRIDGRGTAS